MERAFLYIDILGFSNLVKTNPNKVDEIFKIFDNLKVHKHFALQTVVFSDTILVFNIDKSRSIDYYFTYIIEYSQELFYKLAAINIYCKAVLTYGDFTFSQLKNIQAYYGEALIETYNDEKDLSGFGLFVNKKFTDEVIVLDKTSISEKYDFVYLCQSLVHLYRTTEGILPIDIELLNETDDYYRIDEDLRFLREINYIRNNHPLDKVREKYQYVYDLYKAKLPLFFDSLEPDGFLPMSIHPEYGGSINPFDLISEWELKEK